MLDLINVSNYILIGKMQFKGKIDSLENSKMYYKKDGEIIVVFDKKVKGLNATSQFADHLTYTNVYNAVMEPCSEGMDKAVALFLFDFCFIVPDDTDTIDDYFTFGFKLTTCERRAIQLTPVSGKMNKNDYLLRFMTHTRVSPDKPLFDIVYDYMDDDEKDID
jgi:hypothetical protein